MENFLKFAEERYSVRKYQATPVEQEKIDMILAAANLAPTACNYQPQKIYVVRSAEKLAALKEHTPCTFNAPVVFVVGFDNERRAKGKVNPTHDFGDTDSSIACTHMMLEAHDLGLGSCWVGMFVEEEVRKILDIPETVSVRHLLPVGYPAEDSKPSPMHTKYREMSDMVEER